MSDYGPGPEFGDNEIELNHGADWSKEIDDARKALKHSLSLLEGLKDEWEQDIDLKTGVQGSYKDIKSDELESIGDIIEDVDGAVTRMEGM